MVTLDLAQRVANKINARLMGGRGGVIGALASLALYQSTPHMNS